jgi:hypothetical protein
MPVFHEIFLEWVELPTQQTTNGSSTAEVDFGDWLLAKGSNFTETITTIVQPLIFTHVMTMIWQHYAVGFIENHEQNLGSWNRFAPLRRVLPPGWLRQWTPGRKRNEDDIPLDAKTKEN